MIINSTFISLDGVVENPHEWPSTSGGVQDPAGEELETELLFGCDAVLMGRKTYDAFATAWPSRSGDPFSDRMNSIPKYVVSSTLENPSWTNTSVIPVSAVAGLGGTIVQYGFGQLSFTLLEQGLLDELRLWIYPLIVGRGGPDDLLYRDTVLTTFELVDSRALKTGTVRLIYRRRSL